jgi:hypothetical protein
MMIKGYYPISDSSFGNVDFTKYHLSGLINVNFPMNVIVFSQLDNITI